MKIICIEKCREIKKWVVHLMEVRQVFVIGVMTAIPCFLAELQLSLLMT